MKIFLRPACGSDRDSVETPWDVEGLKTVLSGAEVISVSEQIVGTFPCESMGCACEDYEDLPPNSVIIRGGKVFVFFLRPGHEASLEESMAGFSSIPSHCAVAEVDGVEVERILTWIEPDRLQVQERVFRQAEVERVRAERQAAWERGVDFLPESLGLSRMFHPDHMMPRGTREEVLAFRKDLVLKLLDSIKEIE